MASTSTSTSNVFHYIIPESKNSAGQDLAVVPSGKQVITAVLDYSDENQLWEKRELADSQFAFVHKATGQCISRSANQDALTMTTVDHIEMTPTMTRFKIRDVFNHKVIDSVDGSHHIILPFHTSHPVGEAVICASFPGNTMLQPNLCWSFVQDDSNMSLESLDFDLSLKSVLNLPPILGETQIVVNDYPTEQKQSATFGYTVAETYSFTNATENKITTSIEIKAELPGFSATGGVSIENSISFSTTQTQQTTKTISYTVPVTVPANSKVTCESIVQKGQIDVPYRATVVKTLPNGTQQKIPISGLFRRVACESITTHFK